MSALGVSERPLDDSARTQALLQPGKEPQTPLDFEPRQEFLHTARTLHDFVFLSLNGSETLRVSQAPAESTRITEVLQNTLTSEDVKLLKEDRELGVAEFVINGKPFLNRSLRQEQILLDCISALLDQGFVFVSCLDYGQLSLDKLTLSFRRPRNPPNIRNLPTTTTFGISFASATTVRVVGPPLPRTPAILQVVRSAWPRGVLSEKAEDGFYTFKLKGYPLFKQSTFEQDSLVHISNLLQGMDSHGFDLIGSCNISKGSRLQDFWVFSARSPTSPGARHAHDATGGSISKRLPLLPADNICPSEDTFHQQPPTRSLDYASATPQATNGQLERSIAALTAPSSSGPSGNIDPSHDPLQKSHPQQYYLHPLAVPLRERPLPGVPDSEPVSPTATSEPSAASTTSTRLLYTAIPPPIEPVYNTVPPSDLHMPVVPLTEEALRSVQSSATEIPQDANHVTPLPMAAGIDVSSKLLGSTAFRDSQIPPTQPSRDGSVYETPLVTPSALLDEYPLSDQDSAIMPSSPLSDNPTELGQFAVSESGPVKQPGIDEEQARIRNATGTVERSAEIVNPDLTEKGAGNRVSERPGVGFVAEEPSPPPTPLKDEATTSPSLMERTQSMLGTSSSGHAKLRKSRAPPVAQDRETTKAAATEVVAFSRSHSRSVSESKRHPKVPDVDVPLTVQANEARASGAWVFINEPGSEPTPDQVPLTDPEGPALKEERSQKESAALSPPVEIKREGATSPLRIVEAATGKTPSPGSSTPPAIPSDGDQAAYGSSPPKGLRHAFSWTRSRRGKRESMKERRASATRSDSDNSKHNGRRDQLQLGSARSALAATDEERNESASGGENALGLSSAAGVTTPLDAEANEQNTPLDTHNKVANDTPPPPSPIEGSGGFFSRLRRKNPIETVGVAEKRLTLD